MRSLALAQAWKKQGGVAVFVGFCEIPAVLGRVENEGFKFIPVSKENRRQTAPEFLWKICDHERSRSPLFPWVCLDGYHFGVSYQKALKEIGFRLLVVDDMAHLPSYVADIVLNQNIHSRCLRYSCGPDTTLLLGEEYALIREEFLQWKHWKRRIEEKAGKILVTLGGGDFDDTLRKIVSAIQNAGLSDLEIVVVGGSSSERLKEMVKSPTQKGVRFEIVAHVNDMPQQMASADVAISAGGSTCWELAYMGLPSLVGILAENQREVAQSLGERGMVLNLGWFKELSGAELAKEIQGLVSNEKLRRQMSKTGRETIDGLGAERVCAEVARKAWLQE
jgi:UDP-2,4-diacetamido-2,4,6-trideoxy-beta-L-altropyranose hydrolase